MDLFDHKAKDLLSNTAPLAAKMRPAHLEEIVGQEKVIGEGTPLRNTIQNNNIPSFILWGSPGTGKTSLANLIAGQSGYAFNPISAVTSGVSDLRKIVSDAKNLLGMTGQKTILFIDEIHRFNKAQQDVILPHVEDGSVVLIGATTENPSFEVIAPLLSRCGIFKLEPLSETHIKRIAHRALSDRKRGLGDRNMDIDPEGLELIANMSGGDARWALNVLELCANSLPLSDSNPTIKESLIRQVVQTSPTPYDKRGDLHYDTISAFIKSVRSSDPDSSVYYLARMLRSGEDPMYISRRLVILASEDIGLADPNALTVAISAQHAVHLLGLPEGRIPLSEATIYLATAPKSNSAYVAINSAIAEIDNSGAKEVPYHLRNPVTNLMKTEGYGEGYKYVHNFEDNFVKTWNLPKGLQNGRFYKPTTSGHEKILYERLLKQWDDRYKIKPDR